MMILWLIPGLLLPSISGWLLLRLLEWNHPVLTAWERRIMGCAVGLLLTMYITFLAHIVGLIAFNRLGFLLIHILVAVWLGCGYAIARRHGALSGTSPRHTPSFSGSPLWVRVLATILGTWLTLKVLSGFSLLVLSPPYFDDVLTNWNFRGKMFFFSERLQLEIEPGVVAGTSSYPPAVPMLKANLSAFAGSWNEALISSIHAVWFLCAFALLWFSLRRILPSIWALLGIYILGSLPLYVMHSSAAYADVFLSLHIFLAVSMLYHGLNTKEPQKRMSFLRIGALAAGLLVFTKNEAMLIHLPPLALLVVASCIVLRTKGVMSGKEAQRVLLWYAGMIACVLLPWLLYKWSNGLTFGNAKSITGLQLGYQPGVIKAMWINTFFEANWSLLPVLLPLLLIVGRRIAMRSTLIVPIAFLVAVYIGQMPIYLFTPLATEALMQTGYARGLLQLAPIAVFVTTVLAARALPFGKN